MKLGMKTRRPIMTLLLGVVSLITLITPCAPTGLQAAELRVITSGGFAQSYNLLGPEFSRQTGIELHTSYGSSSGGAPDSIPVRLARGEQFDVIILSQKSLNNLTDQGYVRADTRVDLVRSAIGMAIISGQAKPDISTEEAFIETLLNTESIGYSASASGTYLSTVLWPEMGLWEKIEHKSKRILSERVAAVVARGEVEIGFQQISEILAIEGADYAGPIPDKLQKITTFSTGITSDSPNPDLAQQLIDFISSKEVAETIAETGLMPVALESDLEAD